MTALRLTLILCALGWSAQAQSPGQYPGQYPPGQYPPGQGGRIPGQNPNGGSRGKQQPQPQNKKNSNPIMVTTTTGMLRVTAGNQFVLESDDHRIMTFRISDQAEFLKGGKTAKMEDFGQGDHLSVDANENDEGYLTAVSVRFTKAGTPEDRAAAAETWDLPKLKAVAASRGGGGSVQRDPGDDRPVLRRKNSSGDQPDSNAPSQQPAGTASSSGAGGTGTAAGGNAPSNTAANAPPPEPEDNRPSTQMRPPDPAPDADDPGVPHLRRGVPQRRASSSGNSTSDGPVVQSKPGDNEPAEIALDPGTVAPSRSSANQGGGSQDPGDGRNHGGLNRPVTAASAVIPIEEDPVIQKAREVAAEYSGSLPNFFCKQVTTRYQSSNPKAGWQAQDIVTADVAYEDGQESYKNIMVGNKSKPSMDDIDGARSTGEFATILDAIFAPDTGTTFKRTGTETINHRSTVVFKYEVPRERSRWRIESPAQLYYPAYRGTIWVDKETSRVLRIEQQAHNMPLLFPFDTVETAAEYDFVRLSTPEPYLLPVNAEVLSCVRGTSTCMRNRIEFRNYRKFGAETDITFGPQ